MGCVTGFVCPPCAHAGSSVFCFTLWLGIHRKTLFGASTVL